MRILRIGIHNLNSLRGKHELDFTESPLADNPLYAIVGPTGAGKTTILDAITLALYGQTERNKATTEANREVSTVMTHGTAHCRAEVEFETTDGRYRSVWRRRRAHKKVGRDLQPSEREISRFNPQSGSFDILATKKREVDRLTEEIVGLNFERFVRSVMLTQGAFDRFLKSTSGEKAEILEQITGTDVYKELSEAAFRRHKLAREAYERVKESISQRMPLEAGARAALEAELEEGSKHIIAWTNEVARWTGLRERYLTVDKLTHQLRQVREDGRSLEASWRDLADDRRRLAENDRLEPCRADLFLEQKLAEESREVGESLVTAERMAEEHQRALERSAQARREARERQRANEEGQAEEDQIIQRAEAVEQSLAGLHQEGQRLAAELSSHLRTREKLLAQLRAIDLELQDLARELDGARPADIEENLRRLEETIPRHERELAAVEAAIRYRQLEARIAAERTRATTIQEELTAVRQRLAEHRERVDAATQLVEMQKLRVENASLRAQVADHRHALRADQPCPLCGSCHHPYREQHTPAPENELTEATNQLTRLQNELTRHDNALGVSLQEERAAERQHDRVATLLAELSSQLGEEEPNDSLEGLLADESVIRAELERGRAELTRLRKIRTRLPELRGKEVQRAETDKKRTEVDAAITTLEAQVAHTDRQLREQTTALRQLIGERSVREYRRYVAERSERLQKEVTRLQAEEQRCTTAAASVNERVTVLRERRSNLDREITKVKQRLEQSLADSDHTTTTARAVLLDPARVTHLRQQLREADRKRQAADAMLQRVTEEHAQATQALLEVPPRAEVEESLQAADRQLGETQRQMGAVGVLIRQDDALIRESATLTAELAVLERERDRWGRMNELIGSADGKKFRSFAQGITLQRLVEIGNHHLETINPRYRMQYAPPPPGGKEELEIEIVDTYMNDNRRTMSTLSGGETFLVSLALALGLSDLASGKRLIQSLFIDEGFGTLDGKTLDQAMVTLEQLQAQGKSIGIISHVQQLRERVHCQIRLEPVGDGFSRIELAN
ncbi:AAA family ATPase [Lewinella sp. JB7]|uniref:AAA family ATPase n=1 Tax=Lewinella sp. JB7 TaxID=2962887 RepID=UPI0020C9E7B9|nr:AAA family ATPase [Lewinella sp. JB7]MCP9236503.1 AAA family ATPase [Lewinella sp. JB7]